MSAPAETGSRNLGPRDARSYPDAERLEIVEELHGHRVADPYRWLEDPDDPRTVAWSATQDRLARGYLDALPGRATLAEKIRNLLEAGRCRRRCGGPAAGSPPAASRARSTRCCTSRSRTARAASCSTPPPSTRPG